MLNAKGERELAYVVNVDNIEPIVGSDNCEAAVIGGWRVMVKKGEFKPGDKAVYFEIDSKVDPENPAFAFLEKKHYAIKTQKYTFGGKGNFISQGLIMRPADLGLYIEEGAFGETEVWNKITKERTEGIFLTEQLKVTYYVAEDNKRKAANPEDKYKKMAQRHPAIFRKGFIKWLMKRNWGKKLLFLIFGKKRNSDLDQFPKFVSKTDEERIQNMPWILNDTDDWIVTEKIDGTSTTAALEVGKFGKHKFWICSRNVAFGKKKKKDCFYETNVYTEMCDKYDFEKVLVDIAKRFNAKTVALQGETYGATIQKRDYGMKDRDFRGFNLYVDGKRMNSEDAEKLAAEYGIKWVPIIETIKLPKTVDEMLTYAASTPSVIDGGMREGVVLRSLDATKSFKAVSNEFLLKYHG